MTQIQKEKAVQTKPDPRHLAEDQALRDSAVRAAKVVAEIDAAKPRYDNFQSAEQLGIKPHQHNALIATLKLMEEGKITHVNIIAASGKIYPTDGYLFNMAIWRTEYSCGTVACIGGTAEILGGVGLQKDCRGNRELYRLFYGAGTAYDTTDAQAARALRGYLETGVTKWQKALANP